MLISYRTVELLAPGQPTSTRILGGNRVGQTPRPTCAPQVTVMPRRDGNMTQVRLVPPLRR